MYYLLLYESTLDSAKVMNLPLEAKGFWMLALLAASRNHKCRGILPDLDDLACITRTTLEETKAFVDMLVKARLLILRNDFAYEVYHWDEYQPKTSKERTQRWRDKQNATPEPVTGCDVTARHVTSPNVTVTDPVTVPSESPKTGGDEPNGSKSQNPQDDSRHTDTTCVTSRDVTVTFRRDETRREQSVSSVRDEHSHDACIELTGRLFGEEQSRVLEMQAPEVGSQIANRWDCYDAALRNVHQSLQRTNAKPVKNLVAMCIDLSRKYTANGIPPQAGEVKPVTPPNPEPESPKGMFAEEHRKYREKLARTAAARKGGAA